MAKFKSSSATESLQKWFPLRIVPISDIPHPSRMLDSLCLDVDELASIAHEMIAVCNKNNGIGLSAVQCGLPLKLLIAKTDKTSFRCFLDLELNSEAEQIDSLEGCLSIFDEHGSLRRFLVKRFQQANFFGKEVLIQGLSLSIIDFQETIGGLFCVVLQHEIDHHHGKLIMDEGREVEIIF